ncbi:hypothetical protein RIF29_41949 [Crotalaria pallida]|uniref:Uncharacterized protein n=1 Tax=Crotalaria pallida TaxID=3830 RepID=A0AAN9E8Y9_CROPI
MNQDYLFSIVLNRWRWKAGVAWLFHGCYKSLRSTRNPLSHVLILILLFLEIKFQGGSSIRAWVIQYGQIHI